MVDKILLLRTWVLIFYMVCELFCIGFYRWWSRHKIHGSRSIMMPSTPSSDQCTSSKLLIVRQWQLLQLDGPSGISKCFVLVVFYERYFCGIFSWIMNECGNTTAIIEVDLINFKLHLLLLQEQWIKGSICRFFSTMEILCIFNLFC